MVARRFHDHAPGRPSRIRARAVGAAAVAFAACFVTPVRADLIGYDDSFTFEAPTRTASMRWLNPAGSDKNDPKYGYLSLAQQNLSRITGATLNGVDHPTDTIISDTQWPRVFFESFVFDGSYTVLPSGDYFFYTVQDDYTDGMKVIPEDGAAPVMTADVHTQGITIGEDATWARMDMTLSNIRIDNRIGSDLLDEFAGGNKTGAVRVDFQANQGGNIIRKFINGQNFELKYVGEAGASGGSAVPTPAEWATVLTALLVFGGYGILRNKDRQPGQETVRSG